MKIAIHQPEHLCYLGFFNKMILCDKYVVLNNTQFKKNNFQNRNKLIDNKGNVFWLTIPVKLDNHFESIITDIKIDNSQNWQNKYLNKIKQNYSKHPFFKDYFEEIENIILCGNELLYTLNMQLIIFFRKALNIETPIYISSGLGTTGKKTKLLLDICKKLNATTYLSGSDTSYFDFDLFKNNNINVEVQNFIPKEYPSKNYQPYLSTLDTLFNIGKETINHIKG
jgi:hypothetical protein